MARLPGGVAVAGEGAAGAAGAADTAGAAAASGLGGAALGAPPALGASPALEWRPSGAAGWSAARWPGRTAASPVDWRAIAHGLRASSCCKWIRR
eukprot:1565660-Prymnesium_polylepis.1